MMLGPFSLPPNQLLKWFYIFLLILVHTKRKILFEQTDSSIMLRMYNILK